MSTLPSRPIYFSFSVFSFSAFLLIAVAVAVAAPVASAQTTQTSQPSATLILQPTVEEGKKEIQAVLTRNGKGVEGATIEFRVPRTFGVLPIGKDQTLDDGTAVVPFPADLPGNAAGELQVTAIVQAPPALAGISVSSTFSGATVVHPSSDEFPRALWSPRAPVLLIVSFVTILAAVWCAYVFVVAQIWAIAKGR